MQEVITATAGRPFLTRLWRALWLDRALYTELAGDAHALPQAALVVAFAGMARGVGQLSDEGALGVVLSCAMGLVVWALTSTAVCLIGASRYDYDSDYRKVLRTLGFAAAPLLWLAVGALPLGPGRIAIAILAHALAILSLVLAVRAALKVSPEAAALVCALSLGFGLALVFVLISLAGA